MLILDTDTLDLPKPTEEQLKAIKAWYLEALNTPSPIKVKWKERVPENPEIE